MNTQTFAQAQDFKEINDDELITVNGGGGGECKIYYDLTSSDCLPY